MPVNPTDDLAPLAKAIDGLLYPSESDEPFDLFRWGPATAPADARAQVLSHATATQPIKELSLDDFFAPLETTDDAPRFRALRQALAATLTDLRIFRVGSIRVGIYLIGKTPSAQWAGAHTTSVET